LQPGAWPSPWPAGPALSVDYRRPVVARGAPFACVPPKGRGDLALAGGVQVNGSAEHSCFFERRALLQTVVRETFSANAGRIRRGEGVVVVALERLSDARGGGTKVAGARSRKRHKPRWGIERDHGAEWDVAAKVFRAALRDAGLNSRDVRRGGMPREGTSLGDPDARYKRCGGVRRKGEARSNRCCWEPSKRT